MLFYRYRLKNDIGINHLFIEKDEITLTREWYKTQVPLLETQQKNSIEAQWSKESTFNPGTYSDLWTYPPETSEPETIPVVLESLPQEETNVLVETSTAQSEKERGQAVQEAMNRLFKPTPIVLQDVTDELPE